MSGETLIFLHVSSPTFNFPYFHEGDIVVDYKKRKETLIMVLLNMQFYSQRYIANLLYARSL